MILKQVFKTLAGAQKRAAFENAHCEGRWIYRVVRFDDKVSSPTWRLWRIHRGLRCNVR